MNEKIVYRVLSIVFALLVWEAAALVIHADFLLASPLDVLKTLAHIMAGKDFLSTIVFSFMRISGGFLLAFVAGIVSAIAAGRYRLIEYMLWPFVNTVKSVPIASFIILCLIWMDFNGLTVCIAALIAFPVLYSNVLQGIKSTSSKLIEVAELYQVPFARRLLYLYIPSIKPFLISACTVGIGMAWKAGIAAEVIGVIKGSIGGKLYDAKIYFQNAELLTWTIVIIAVSILSERLFLYLIKGAFRMMEKL